MTAQIPIDPGWWNAGILSAIGWIAWQLHRFAARVERLEESLSAVRERQATDSGRVEKLHDLIIRWIGGRPVE